MKRLFLAGVGLLAPLAVHSQNLGIDLNEFVRTPAVSGYEQALAEKIRARLQAWKPQTDNLGNVWVTIGEGAPHRLLVASMDEPGYVISAITPDGYLRLQRLPQQAPHGLFDQLHSAQPMLIHTRKGTWVTGVVAGPSTHLQPGRRNPVRVNHLDDMFIDIGATSAAEVRKAGVDVLDPVAIERNPVMLDMRKINSPAVGDRFGAAVLSEVAARIDAGKLKGKVTIAFVAQQWASSRGLDRLLQHVRPDEMVYVGRLFPRRGAGGGQAAAAAQAPATQLRRAKAIPGAGVLVAVDNPDAGLTGLASELELLAVREGITVAKDYSASIPRVSYTQGPRFPERLAHLSVATAWPVTPAEFLDRGDLAHLANLLSKWIGAPGEPRPSVAEMRPTPPIERPRTAPPVNDILKKLVEAYGVSGAEERVRQVVQDLLPPWASPVTDDAGNLILRIPAGGAGGKNANRIAFVAHMDEIGYEVRSISDDGRLVVRTRGGGNPEFFQGHSMLVHRKEGELLMGVLELPAGWDEANFEWPRGAQAGGVRLDIGARSVAEVSERNVRAGDTVTIPKKYRPLLGHRANGRSFDDRVGCAALISAAWALGKNAQGGQAMPKSLPAEIILIWATREELGLEGALADAAASAQKGETPDYVFAVDTFVSSDSPIELQRFADAPIGKGFVIRAVDNSNITDRKYVDKLIALARAHQIPVQYGITGGGNDGAAYLRHGAVDIPISWPLRYSHSPGEVIDTRDVDALARIVAAIARSW